jgi:hypothetical protein
MSTDGWSNGNDLAWRRADLVVAWRRVPVGPVGTRDQIGEWRYLKNREGSCDEPVNVVDLAMKVLGLGALPVTPERIELLKLLDSTQRLGGAAALDELLLEALVRRRS